MPTLDWLNRAQAFTISARVPYRLLEEVSVHTPAATSETPAAEPALTQPAQAELLTDRTEPTSSVRPEPVEGSTASTSSARTAGNEITDNLLIQGDRHAPVKRWVRNLTTAPCGFALATSRGRFFPDFVAELVDGRIAVVEYKGAHLINDPYEIEKRQIGELWARKSGNRCLFGQIVKERDGLSMSQQLDALLA